MAIFGKENVVERYGRKSILDYLGTNIKMFSKPLHKISVEDLPNVEHTLNDSRVMFSWTKGANLVVMVHEGVPMTYTKVLESLGLEVTMGEVLPKRLARAFAFRDVVVTLKSDAIRIEYVDDDEFTTADDDQLTNAANNAGSTLDKVKAQLLDGCGSIRKSFAQQMCIQGKVSMRRLRKAEALSLTLITNEGNIKGLFYVTDDEDMVVDADIVCSRENLKGNLKMSHDGFVYLAFDFHNAYGAPTTNAQLEVNMGTTIFTVKRLNFLLTDRLTKVANAIKDGSILPEWTKIMSRPENFKTSNRVADNFVHMGHMVSEVKARGLDPRHFPALVSNLANAEANQWYDTLVDEDHAWYRFPIACAEYHPVISESMAVLIGESIEVERGTCKYARHGDVVVVNDLDFVEFFTINAGGSDGDDHYIVMQVTVKDVKHCLIVRIPNGLGEYNLLKFTEGPTYEYTTHNGEVITFPKVPGEFYEQLADGLRNGNRKYTGIPNVKPQVFGTAYTAADVYATVEDVVSSNTFVGSVMNRMFLAAGTNRELLNSQMCGVEEIIDLFTKGGAIDARVHLQVWADQIPQAIVDSKVKVDPKLWNARVGFLPEGFVMPQFEDAMFSKLDKVNKTLRANFKANIEKFSQAWAITGNSTLTAALKVFNMKRTEVKFNTSNRFINEAKEIRAQFNKGIYNLLNNNEEGQQLGWQELYQQVRDSIDTYANGDEHEAMDLTLALWVVCMSIPNTMGNFKDTAVVNYKCFHLLMKAMSYYGIAFYFVKNSKDVEARQVASWNVTCKSCGTVFTTENPNHVMFAHQVHKTCKACR